MRVLLGSAVLLTLGAAACGGNDESGNGTGSSDDPDRPSTSSAPAGPERPSTSTRSPVPEVPEVPEPLPKPKPPVPLSVTPPPLKPQSGPTDRLTPVTVTGTLAEPVPGCLVVEADNGRWALVGTPEGFGVGDRVEVTGRPAPEVEGACGAPVIRVREIRPA